jgi:hypothetical protein
LCTYNGQVKTRPTQRGKPVSWYYRTRPGYDTEATARLPAHVVLPSASQRSSNNESIGCPLVQKLLIVHVVTVASRTLAPGSSSTASALALVIVARAALAGWRRAHKGKVDGDLLLKELLAVGALDSGLCFFQGSVLDEDVALYKVSSATRLDM